MRIELKNIFCEPSMRPSAAMSNSRAEHGSAIERGPKGSRVLLLTAWRWETSPRVKHYGLMLNSSSALRVEGNQPSHAGVSVQQQISKSHVLFQARNRTGAPVVTT